MTKIEQSYAKILNKEKINKRTVKLQIQICYFSCMYFIFVFSNTLGNFEFVL